MSRYDSALGGNGDRHAAGFRHAIRQFIDAPIRGPLAQARRRQRRNRRAEQDRHCVARHWLVAIFALPSRLSSWPIACATKSGHQKLICACKRTVHRAALFSYHSGSRKIMLQRWQPCVFPDWRCRGARSCRRNCAFTLIEILVVLAIISILAALLLPAL